MNLTLEIIKHLQSFLSYDDIHYFLHSNKLHFTSLKQEAIYFSLNLRLQELDLNSNPDLLNVSSLTHLKRLELRYAQLTDITLLQNLLTFWLLSFLPHDTTN